MKDLIIAVAVALSVALAILAAAVYRTWNVELMTLLTDRASITCLVIPAIAVAVATVIVVQRAVDHHYDAKEAEQAARLQERASASATRAVQVMTVAKHEQDLGNRQARGETEMLRAARILAGLQAPQIAAPGESGAVRNPWLLGYDDDDEDEGDSDGN